MKGDTRSLDYSLHELRTKGTCREEIYIYIYMGYKGTHRGYIGGRGGPIKEHTRTVVQGSHSYPKIWAI